MPIENSHLQNGQSQVAANSALEPTGLEVDTDAGGPPAQPLIPPDVQKLFGPPPLLIGEDPTHYNRLLEEWVIALAPQSIVEWLWVKDCADESWEALRHSRFKSALISLGRKAAIREIMREAIDHSRPDHREHAERLASGWFTDAKVKEQVSELLTAMGLTELCIDAKALSSCASKYTKIDTLRGGVMARRNVALREIDRRRAEITQSIKDTSKVIDEPAEEAGIAPSDNPPTSVKSE
jgi:hypothetical protein